MIVRTRARRTARQQRRAGRRNTALFGFAVALLCLAACAPTVPAETSFGQPAASAATQPATTATTTVTTTATAAATETVTPGGTTATATATATATTPSGTSPSGRSPTAPTPSGNPPAPPSTPAPAPTGWKTVLDDEFTAAGIPAHWGLYNGHYGSGPSNNCAAPSQDSAPGDGYLYLTMSYKTSGTCGAGWYEGGMMVSDPYQYTSQAVTVRWRIIPSAHPSIVRSHHIIPMLFPHGDPAYSWYSAEDDLCEGGQIASCDTFLHDGTASDTSKQVYNVYTVDLTRWHTWRFEQRHGTLTVYLDNMTTPVWTMSQGTGVLPDTLRSVTLQQECPASACPPASYAGDTEQIQIDWITIQVPGA